MSAAPDDLGARWAEELRQASNAAPARDDFSWLTDNPDKLPILPRRPLAWADLKAREPLAREWAVQDWENTDEIIAAAVRGYRRDYWQDQPRRVEVWSEKGTIRGTLREFHKSWQATKCEVRP